MGKSQSSKHFAGALARRCSSVSRTTRCGVAVAAVALMLAPAAARAQGPAPATVAVTINIPAVLYLGCTAPCSFTFPDADDAAYQAGLLASSSGPTLTHRGNVPYRITIGAQTGTTLGFANLTGRTDPDPNRPTTDLTLRATTGASVGGYTQLAPAGSSNTLYTRSSAGGNQQSTIDARLALGYATNPPGQYTTIVVFTIVAP